MPPKFQLAYREKQTKQEDERFKIIRANKTLKLRVKTSFSTALN